MERQTHLIGNKYRIYFGGKEFSGERVDKIAELENEAEQREKGCEDCSGAREFVCYTARGKEKKMNYCATCGRKLGE